MSELSMVFVIHRTAVSSEKAKDFQEKMSQGKLFLLIEIMNFLKDWLSNHIMDSDKKFGSHLREMGLS